MKKQIKKCLICENSVNKGYYESWKRYNSKKYCSRDCFFITQRGRKLSPEEIKKSADTRRGQKMSPEFIEMCRERQFGTKMSTKTRLKMSQTHRKRVEEGKQWNYHGKFPLFKYIRESVQYKLWRLDVYKRDKYTCQTCNKKGCRTLNADHIIPFGFLLYKYKIESIKDAIRCSNLWDINNGKTLCEQCHRQTDTFAMPLRTQIQIYQTT